MLKRTLPALLAAVICHAAAGGENYSMEFCGNRNRLFADGKEITFADCLKEQTATFRCSNFFKNSVFHSVNGN